jgi:hypothetical protein
VIFVVAVRCLKRGAGGARIFERLEIFGDLLAAIHPLCLPKPIGVPRYANPAMISARILVSCIFSLRYDAKIRDAVVGAIVIDVVNQPIWPLTVMDGPRRLVRAHLSPGNEPNKIPATIVRCQSLSAFPQRAMD